MRSRGAYRLRVGQYRVIYEINDLQVRITGLVLKFGVPGIGEAEDTQTDLARVQMFVRVVNGLVDELAGYLTPAEYARQCTHQMETDDSQNVRTE